jgi:hypothetical protein
MAAIYKTRVFEDYGIYISIVFARDLDREPAWRFIIESVEDHFYTSRRYGDYAECEKAALIQAIDYLNAV